MSNNLFRSIGGIILAAALLISSASMANALLTSVQCNSANGNLIYNSTGVGSTPLAIRSYVQIIQSDDATPGAPDPATGLPAEDTRKNTGTLSSAGTFSGSADIDANKYVYIRAWETWKGTGTPSGKYGTSVPVNVGSGFGYTYKPASFATTSQINVAPNIPASLAQGIANGAWVNTNFNITMSMSDTNNPDTLTPQVEAVTGNFTGTPNFTGAAVQYAGSAVTGTVTINVAGLSDGVYKWQARVRDTAGATSDFVPYSGNPSAFQVDKTAPSAVTITSPSSPTNNTGLTFSWTAASDSGSGLHTTTPYYYLLNSSSNTDANTVKNTGTATTNTSITATGNQGNNYLHVVAIDALGNLSSVAHSSLVVVDTTPPAVSSTNPANTASGVRKDLTQITVTFNDNMETTSVQNVNNYSVSGAQSGVHTITNASYNDTNKTVTLTISGAFQESENVNCAVKTGVKDKAGNSLASQYSWSFQIAAPAAPSITGITPNSGKQGAGIPVAIAGTNFRSGATAKLTKTGQTDINITVSNVTATEITGSLTITANAQTGQWNVVVTNHPDEQSGTLSSGFTISTVPAPTIDHFELTSASGTPITSAKVYDGISIIGSNFGADPGAGNRSTSSNNITFYNNVKVPENQVYFWSEEKIDVGVPVGAATGNVTVTVKDIVSNGKGITIAPTTISNLSIVRDADTQGASITLTWQTVPSNSGVDIYTKTGDFSAAASDWTKAFSNVTSGSQKDNNQVGTGTAKYYKVIQAGKTLADSDLTSDVLGKFDIAVGPAATEPGKLFISLPLVQLAGVTPEKVFGAQARNTDMLVSFDIDKNVTQGSMRENGAWTNFPGVTEITALETGFSYGYITSTSRNLTIVGKVKSDNFSRTLSGKQKAHWLGNPYPASVAIADAGLNASSANANLTQAGIVYQFDANAELISGTDGMAAHTASTEWKDGTLNKASPLALQPGRGYMFVEPTKDSVDWSLNRPY